MAEFGVGPFGAGPFGVGKPIDNIPEDDADVEQILHEIDNRLQAIENQSTERHRTLAEIERDLHDLNIQMSQSEVAGWIQFSITITLALGVQPSPLAVYAVIGVWVLYVTSLSTS